MAQHVTDSVEETFDRDGAFPRLTEEQLAVLERVGERRPLVAGEILFGPGDRYDFFAVVRGRVAIVDDYGCAQESVVGVHGDSRFLGELSLITGGPPFLPAVGRAPGQAIVVARDALQGIV